MLKVRDELNIAMEAARKAGDFLRKRNDIRVDAETGKDLKLSSDKMSETIICNYLSSTGYSMLSEEMGFVDKGTDLCWIIDPLDGSVNYQKGMDDLCCISIALWNKETPIIGVVYRFMKDEMFCGEIGLGAFLNGEPIKPSDVTDVSAAVLACGFPVKRSYDTESLCKFVRQVQSFKKIRMLGAAAVMGTFVAAGRIDAYMEEDIMLWDIAGASAIVMASGGEAYITRTGDDRCICRLFANKELLEDYEVMQT